MNSKRSPSAGEEALSLQEPLRCPFKTGYDPGLGAYGSANSSPVQAHAPAPVLNQPHMVQENQQSGATSRLPASVLEYLPTFFHDSNKMVIRVEEAIETYLKMDLDLDRLNQIHSSLWMCGRPINARALHRNHVLNRKIVPTEQADLHLLYYENIIMVKALPIYLLQKEVWDQYLNKNRTLHENACGLLLSYIWLVRSPVDFRLAMAKNQDIALLPPGLDWATWKRIVDESLQYIDADTLHQVNKRYQFGELRLGRINSIYKYNPRFIFTNFVRGYLYGYNRYAVFFQRNVAWILVASVLFSLVLSAMQVGVAVDPLMTNESFKKASYGFVVFAIALVAGVIAFVGLVFVSIFLFNMVTAIRQSKTEQGRRKDMADKKRLDSERGGKNPAG